MKIFEGLSNSKNMVFNVKKLLGRIQRRPMPPNQLAAVGGILVVGRLATICARLEFAELLDR
jgi:hypothetical protein